MQNFPTDAASLIRDLLRPLPADRLGLGVLCKDGLKHHEFFVGVNLDSAPPPLHQVSPPTINIFNQDPECDLDYCANTARDMKIEYAAKNNFGFGGTNGTLIFKRV